MIAQSDISEFMDITGANEQTARQFLSKNALPIAINLFFERPDLASTNNVSSTPQDSKKNESRPNVAESKTENSTRSLSFAQISNFFNNNKGSESRNLPQITPAPLLSRPPIDHLVQEFMSITETTEAEAKKYVARAGGLNTALDLFFSGAKIEDEVRPPSSFPGQFGSLASLNFLRNTRNHNDSDDEDNSDDDGLNDDEDDDDNDSGDSDDDNDSANHPLANLDTGSYMTLNFRNRPKFPRRKRRKDMTKALPINIEEEDIEVKYKNDYHDYVKPYLKGNISKMNKDKIWPKYLGTLIANLKLTEFNGIRKGDKLTFKPSSIEFQSSNQTRKRTTTDSNGKKTVHQTVKKTWTIKAQSLYVEVLSKDRMIGLLSCEFEELFVFLLLRKYIFLEGLILTSFDKRCDYVRIQLNVFLTDEVIKNPLRYVAKTGRKGQKGPKNIEVEEDEESEDAQKQHQVLRLTKESLNKLFDFLKLKVGIPTVVRMRQKQDPFQRIINDKNKKKGFSVGPPLVVATEQFARYYTESEQARRNLSTSNMLRKDSDSLIIDSDDDLDEELDHYFGDKPGSKKEPIQIEEEKDETVITGQNSNHFNQSEAPSTFKSDLHAYQKQALHWMKYREEMIDEKDLYNQQAPPRRELHDLFQEVFMIDDSKIYFNPFNGEITDVFPKSRMCKGGILADEMGLGKTVMAIALIHSNRRHPPREESTKIVLKKFGKAITTGFDPETKKVKKNEDKISEESSKTQIKRSKTANPNTLDSFLKFSKSQKIENEDSKIIRVTVPPFECEDSVVMLEESQKDAKANNSDDEFANLGFGKSIDGLKQAEKRKRNNASRDGLDQDFVSTFADEDDLRYSKKKPVSTQVSVIKGYNDNDDDLDFLDESIPKDLTKDFSSNENSKTRPQRKAKEKAKTFFDELEDIDNDISTDEPVPDKGKKGSKPKQSNTQPIIKRKDSFEELGFGKSDPFKSDPFKAGTLIVVPLTVLSQWYTELENHSKEKTLSIVQYYGSNRNKVDLSAYDVVITTYGILENEFDKNKEGIFDYHWLRIILDEAHQIKSRVTKTSKAAYSVKADFRWCMTGTPLQNKLDDLFSILKFLRVEIWGDYIWWNTYINKGISNSESAQVVRGILGPIFLRRTKKSTYLDGRNILQLPGKEVQTVFVEMTKEERNIYKCLFSKGKDQFNEIVTGGLLNHDYAHVFELLVRLRQVCDHPALVFSKDEMRDKESLESAVMKFIEKKGSTSLLGPKPGEESEKETSKGINSEFVKTTIENLKKKELEPCGVCLEEILIPLITKCCHVFCKTCLVKSFEAYKRCPLCMTTLSAGDFLTVEDEANVDEQKDLLDMNSTNFKKSSKVAQVIENIKLVKQKGEKVVIFSQFIKMLNITEKFIKDEGIEYRRIDGSCTLKNRSNSIDEFKNDPRVTVIMISLKAGATGLNLTAARHVFLIDPWWNPAIEDQAIERVHRIGQLQSVSVKRFICKKTIEERILQLNDKKKALISLTLNYNPADQKKENLENMIFVMKGFDDE